MFIYAKLITKHMLGKQEEKTPKQDGAAMAIDIVNKRNFEEQLKNMAEIVLNISF